MNVSPLIKKDIKRAIEVLECYKRSIGRVYNRHKYNSLAELYNQLEDEIATLSTRYNIKRKSKPYKLQVKGE